MIEFECGCRAEYNGEDWVITVFCSEHAEEAGE